MHSLVFSPKNYWLCAATDNSIKIWDLENKSVHDEIAAPCEALGRPLGLLFLGRAHEARPRGDAPRG